MDPRRLRARLVRGDVANVSFSDMRRLVGAFGFELRREANVQEIAGQAKPYQVRQFLRLVERYALRMESER